MSQIQQLQFQDGVYNVTPVSEKTYGQYQQNRDKDVIWGTYAATGGVLGLPVGFGARNTYDRHGMPLMFSTGPWWIDGNHATDDKKFLSLPFFLFSYPVKGYELFFNKEFCFLSGEDLHIKGTLQGNNIDLKGGEFGFWIQCQCNKTGKHGNYFLKQTLSDKLTEDESEFELNISLNDFDNWEVLGACPEKVGIYNAIPINALINDYTVISFGFVIYGYKVKHILEDNRRSSATVNVIRGEDRGRAFDTWPIDTSTLPQGTILLRNLDIKYTKTHELVFHR